MRPAFADPTLWVQFRDEVGSWIGTPYRHNTMVKGRGADCSLFLGACLKNAGILSDIVYDYYPKDWFSTADRDMIVDNLYTHFADHAAPGFAIRQLPPTAPVIRGDFLAFATCATRPSISNHAGVLIQRARMAHCAPGRGVQVFQFGDCWSRRLRHVFRIMRTT